MIKKVFLLISLFGILCFSSCSFDDEDRIELTGTWSYLMDFNNRTINIKGGKIANNNRKKSETITLKVCATKTKYTGGTLSGYTLCEIDFDPLESKHSYSDINKTVSMRIPPDGEYYICLYTFHKGYITSYISFKNVVYFNVTPSSTSPGVTPIGHQVTCSTCKGTGYSLYASYATNYGTDLPLMRPGEKCQAYPYCSVIYSHYHKRCPSCGGKGTVYRVR